MIDAAEATCCLHPDHAEVLDIVDEFVLDMGGEVDAYELEAEECELPVVLRCRVLSRGRHLGWLEIEGVGLTRRATGSPDVRPWEDDIDQAGATEHPGR